jgi:hypothetical protein
MSAAQTVVANRFLRCYQNSNPQPQDPIGWELWVAASIPLVGTISGFFAAIIFG